MHELHELHELKGDSLQLLPMQQRMRQQLRLLLQVVLQPRLLLQAMLVSVEPTAMETTSLWSCRSWLPCVTSRNVCSSTCPVGGLRLCSLVVSLRGLAGATDGWGRPFLRALRAEMMGAGRGFFAPPLHVRSRCRSTRGATPTLGLYLRPLMVLLFGYPASHGISWLYYFVQSLNIMA